MSENMTGEQICKKCFPATSNDFPVLAKLIDLALASAKHEGREEMRYKCLILSNDALERSGCNPFLESLHKRIKGYNFTTSPQQDSSAPWVPKVGDEVCVASVVGRGEKYWHSFDLGDYLKIKALNDYLGVKSAICTHAIHKDKSQILPLEFLKPSTRSEATAMEETSGHLYLEEIRSAAKREEAERWKAAILEWHVCSTDLRTLRKFCEDMVSPNLPKPPNPSQESPDFLAIGQMRSDRA